VRYVDAGYIAALGAMFMYAISLLLRRRRWERALSVSRASEFPDGAGAGAGAGAAAAPPPATADDGTTALAPRASGSSGGPT
jgi:hypothetical protein